jgi:hypothetical protein
VPGFSNKKYLSWGNRTPQFRDLLRPPGGVLRPVTAL